MLEEFEGWKRGLKEGEEMNWVASLTQWTWAEAFPGESEGRGKSVVCAAVNEDSQRILKDTYMLEHAFLEIMEMQTVASCQVRTLVVM